MDSECLYSLWAFFQSELKWICDSMADNLCSGNNIQKSYYAVSAEYYEIACWYILL